MALDYVDQYDFAAGGFDFFAANDLIAGPVSAFHENVGQQGGDSFLWRQFVEK